MMNAATMATVLHVLFIVLTAAVFRLCGAADGEALIGASICVSLWSIDAKLGMMFKNGLQIEATMSQPASNEKHGDSQ